MSWKLEQRELEEPAIGEVRRKQQQVEEWGKDRALARKTWLIKKSDTHLDTSIQMHHRFLFNLLTWEISVFCYAHTYDVFPASLENREGKTYKES